MKTAAVIGLGCFGPAAAFVWFFFFAAPAAMATGTAAQMQAQAQQQQQAGAQPGAPLPVSGPPTPGNPLGPECPHPPLSQSFGPSSLSGEPAAHGYAHFHTGMDLACPYGTQIHNIDVVGIAHVLPEAKSGGFGNEVVVEAQTPQGHFFIRYGHMSRFSDTVKDGQAVQIGDLLGWEGCTGYCTGPHLHFEVDQNQESVQSSIDPSSWLVL